MPRPGMAPIRDTWRLRSRQTIRPPFYDLNNSAVILDDIEDPWPQAVVAASSLQPPLGLERSTAGEMRMDLDAGFKWSDWINVEDTQHGVHELIKIPQVRRNKVSRHPPRRRQTRSSFQIRKDLAQYSRSMAVASYEKMNISPELQQQKCISETQIEIANDNVSTTGPVIAPPDMRFRKTPNNEEENPLLAQIIALRSRVIHTRLLRPPWKRGLPMPFDTGRDHGELDEISSSGMENNNQGGGVTDTERMSIRESSALTQINSPGPYVIGEMNAGSDRQQRRLETQVSRQEFIDDLASYSQTLKHQLQVLNNPASQNHHSQRDFPKPALSQCQLLRVEGQSVFLETVDTGPAYVLAIESGALDVAELNRLYRAGSHPRATTLSVDFAPTIMGRIKSPRTMNSNREETTVNIAIGKLLDAAATYIRRCNIGGFCTEFISDLRTELGGQVGNVDRLVQWLDTHVHHSEDTSSNYRLHRLGRSIIPSPKRPLAPFHFDSSSIKHLTTRTSVSGLRRSKRAFNISDVAFGTFSIGIDDDENGMKNIQHEHEQLSSVTAAIAPTYFSDCASVNEVHKDASPYEMDSLINELHSLSETGAHNASTDVKNAKRAHNLLEDVKMDATGEHPTKRIRLSVPDNEIQYAHNTSMDVENAKRAHSLFADVEMDAAGEHPTKRIGLSVPDIESQHAHKATTDAENAKRAHNLLECVDIDTAGEHPTKRIRLSVSNIESQPEPIAEHTLTAENIGNVPSSQRQASAETETSFATAASNISPAREASPMVVGAEPDPFWTPTQSLPVALNASTPTRDLSCHGAENHISKPMATKTKSTKNLFKIVGRNQSKNLNNPPAGSERSWGEVTDSNKLRMIFKPAALKLVELSPQCEHSGVGDISPHVEDSPARTDGGMDAVVTTPTRRQTMTDQGQQKIEVYESTRTNRQLLPNYRHSRHIPVPTTQLPGYPVQSPPSKQNGFSHAHDHQSSQGPNGSSPYIYHRMPSVPPILPNPINFSPRHQKQNRDQNQLPHSRSPNMPQSAPHTPSRHHHNSRSTTDTSRHNRSSLPCSPKSPYSCREKATVSFKTCEEQVRGKEVLMQAIKRDPAFEKYCIIGDTHSEQDAVVLRIGGPMGGNVRGWVRSVLKRFNTHINIGADTVTGQ